MSSSSLSWAQKAAVAWLILLALVAAVAPMLPLPYSPSVPDLAHVSQSPGGPGQHWLGTDPQGLDVLSLLVFGARTAVSLTLPAAILAASVGALAGGAAGFWGNRLRVDASYWLLLAGAAWWVLQLPAAWAGAAMGAVGVAGLLWGLRYRPVVLVRFPLEAAAMGAATTLDTIPHLVLAVAIAASAGGVSSTGLLGLLALTAWSGPARLVSAQMLRVR